MCDVNGDGQNDVVSSQQSLYWYEGPTWVEHLIASDVLHDIEVLDFDGDGDCDIAGRNQGPSAAAALLSTLHGDLPTSWDRKTKRFRTARAWWRPTSTVMRTSTWWSTRYGSRTKVPTSRPGLSTSIPTARAHDAAFVAIADMDADGHLDVLLSPSELKGDSYRISWFEASR